MSGSSLTVISTIPALFCILGALAYALTSNAKVAELGRIAYACGLLVTLATLVSHVVRF